MFEKDEATLTSMGAQITTKEIMQQPDLWEGTLKIYEDNLGAIGSTRTTSGPSRTFSPRHVRLVAPAAPA